MTSVDKTWQAAARPASGKYGEAGRQATWGGSRGRERGAPEGTTPPHGTAALVDDTKALVVLPAAVVPRPKARFLLGDHHDGLFKLDSPADLFETKWARQHRVRQEEHEEVAVVDPLAHPLLRQILLVHIAPAVQPHSGEEKEESSNIAARLDLHVRVHMVGGASLIVSRNS